MADRPDIGRPHPSPRSGERAATMVDWQRWRVGDGYRFGYEVEGRCLRLVAVGDCPYLEILDLLYDMLSDPGIQGPLPLIVDARASTQTGLDVEAAKHIVRLMASRPEVVGRRRAIVVSNPYHAFLARVASIHARTWYGIESGVFDSLEEGQLWVANAPPGLVLRPRPSPRGAGRRSVRAAHAPRGRSTPTV